MRGADATCGACGAPTQSVELVLAPSAADPQSRVMVVQHCTSLLCPTNLDDGVVHDVGAGEAPTIDAGAIWSRAG